MPIPELARDQAQQVLSDLIERRSPQGLRDKIRLSTRVLGNTMTLFEHHPAFDEPDAWAELEVAQFRYDPTSQLWSLYCADRNGRWHRYTHTRPTRDFAALAREVDEDPTCIFWG